MSMGGFSNGVFLTSVKLMSIFNGLLLPSKTFSMSLT
jgi:hypothetical protein